ncbi:MAG: hypothetical protein EBY26_04605 [Microbacteriaceae bacterium]|nr:hypothetical protein [Microbacteriaceae bacterium]
MTKPSYRYEQTPHAEARKSQHPAEVKATAKVKLNDAIGLAITRRVGTMWAAYIFFALTLISLPAALSSGNTLVIVGWVAQTFLQLVLLPIIIVGQNLQAKDSEKRAIATYEDAGAILDEAREIQSHLGDQDKALSHLIDRMETLEKIIAKQAGKN